MIRQKLFNKQQTVKAIDRIVNTHYKDIAGFWIMKNNIKIPLCDLPLKKYYNLVKRIPYQRDTKPIEILLRPFFLLNGRTIGLDCKKKTILMAAYFKCNNIRFRYMGSSQRPDRRIHHIYTQIKTGDNWKNVDATYPENNIFENKRFTKVEVLK